jgi:hypothetical protein
LNAQLDFVRYHNRVQPDQVSLGAGVFAGDPGGGLGSRWQPVDTEMWDFATEFGFLCGPSKTSFLFTWNPGPDRRNGIWISKSAFGYVAFSGPICNTTLFLPYSYLLAYTYGGGLNVMNARGEGGMLDATTVGARLDYAVAANLNVYGTFFWAWRNSGAWPWGVLTIDSGSAVAASGVTGANAAQVFGVGSFGLAPQNSVAVLRAPNIPDNNLGYEFDAGLDWKLLEGLTMNLRGAVWQPGEWFKFACLDRAVVTTAAAVTSAASGAAGNIALQPTGLAANNFGVNPAKTIDPIWSFAGSLNVDF